MNIAVLAQQLGTTPYSIRFYERRGLIPSPERKGNGYRDYTEVEPTGCGSCCACADSTSHWSRLRSSRRCAPRAVVMKSRMS